MNDKTIKSASFALLLFLSSVTGGGAFLAMGTQTASADIGEQGDCKDDVVGLITGTATTLYSNYRDPCFTNNQDANITDTDTEEEAARAIARNALESKRFTGQYFDQFDKNTDKIENPAYLDAKTTFIQEMRNGSTETAAITAARTAVHDRTASQQRALWMEYRSLADTMAHLEADAEDAQIGDNIRIGFQNTTSGQVTYGYTLAGWEANNSTANVTLSDGSQVEVPAPYKTDNGTVTDSLNPNQEHVIVSVYNPESGSWESVINSAEYTSKTLGTWSGGSFETTFSEPVTKIEGNTNRGSTDFVAGLEFDVEKDNGNTVTYRIEWPTNTYTKIYKDGTQVHSYGSAAGTGHKPTIQQNDDGTFTVTNGLDMSYTTNVGGQIVAMRHTSQQSVQGTSYTAYNANSAMVGSFSDEFQTRHDTLETADNNVIDALGNESSGYLSDAYSNVQTGDLNWSDIYTPGERYRMSVDSADVGEQSWLSYQYQYLGIGGADTGYTVELKVHNGSTIDGAEISENKTIKGHLFTDSTPPNGTWTANETYTVNGSSADLSSTVYLQRTVTTSYEENGTITYETEGVTTSISDGEVTVVSIRNSDGETIDSADHTDREASSTDVSNLTDQINNLQQTIETLREDMNEDDNDSSGGGWIGDGDGGSILDPSDWDGVTIFGIQTPFDTVTVTVAGVVLVGLISLPVLPQIVGAAVGIGRAFK